MGMQRCIGIGILLLGFALGSAKAEEHTHEHNDAALQALQLNQGSKWATDESLRQGMNRIHASFSAESAAISSGQMTPERYQALAQKIHTEIAWLVTNCKLDARTDAMLHIILAELIDGAEAMAGKKLWTKPRYGALKVGQALDNYATYFDHPGWGGVEK